MVAESIVESVQEYLQAVRDRGIQAEYGVVYGSQARGDTRAWSDIDLLVVSSQYDQRRTYEEAGALWEVAAFTDSRIEPISPRHLANNHPSPPTRRRTLHQ